MPVILSVSQNSVISDANGQASIVPSARGFNGPLQVNVTATTGTNAMLEYPLQLLPAFQAEAGSEGSNQPILRSPLRMRSPINIEK